MPEISDELRACIDAQNGRSAQAEIVQAEIVQVESNTQTGNSTQTEANQEENQEEDERPICDNCNERADEVYTVHRTRSRGGYLFCQDCVDNRAFRCSTCGELFMETLTGPDREEYCRACFSGRFYLCENCGAALIESDIYGNDNYSVLCSSCYTEMNRDNDDEYINNHDYKPEPNYIYKSGDPPVDFYGMELELECPDDERSETAERILDIDSDSIYLKEDGSLNNGIELVTHPHSFECLNEHEHLPKILDILRKRGCKSHDTSTCGIHIHLTLSAFKNNAHLYRFLKIIYENYNFTLTISQRKDENLRRWAGFDTSSDYGLRKKSREKKNQNGSRYCACNITGQTLEVRIFRGSLLWKRVRKNLQFVKALFEYSKKAKTPETCLPNFIAYIAENQSIYNELHSFIQEKGLDYVHNCSNPEGQSDQEENSSDLL